MQPGRAGELSQALAKVVQVTWYVDGAADPDIISVASKVRGPLNV